MLIGITTKQLKEFTLKKGKKYRFIKYREAGTVEEEIEGVVLENYDRYISIKTKHGLRDSLLKIDLLGKNYTYKELK